MLKGIFISRIGGILIMEENKYGNLLDKYINGNNSKVYNGMIDNARQKCAGEAGNRYGNLLKNVKPDMDCLNTMVNLEDERRRKKAKEAEAERESNAKRQNRIEREKKEHENHVASNTKFVNDFLEKKRNEQERKDRETQGKRKKTEEEQKIYSDIDKLMNISPKLADAYVGVMANIKK